MRSFKVLLLLCVILIDIGVTVVPTYGFEFVRPEFIKSSHLKYIWKILRSEDRRSSVNHMKVNAEEDTDSPSLKKLVPSENGNHQHLDLDKVVKNPQNQLVGFSYQSCGPKDQVINLKKLTISPDPVYIPGNLTISFDIEFLQTIPNKDDLDAQLMLDVRSGDEWVNIPCIGSTGSCKYTDICGQLSAIKQCPQEMVAAGIPCKCPFKKADYHLENLNVMLTGEIYPGSYRANVTFFNNRGQLGCYKCDFTIG